MKDKQIIKDKQEQKKADAALNDLIRRAKAKNAFVSETVRTHFLQVTGNLS